MRVLIVTPEYAAHDGGIGTYYRSLAPALVAIGCEVVVVEGSGFESYDSPQPSVDEGVTIHRLERSRVAQWSEHFQHVQAAPVLRQMLAGAWAAWEQAELFGEFDAIESTDFGLMSLPAALKRRSPVVTQMHGSLGQISMRDRLADAELDGALSLALETAGARLVEGRQTSSRSNAAYWRRQTSTKVDCLRPAWKPIGPVGRALPNSRIAVFGRIQQWKGPQIVCEALRRMPSAPEVDWYGRDVARDAYASTGDWLRQSYPGIWGVKIQAHAPIPRSAVHAIQSTALLNLVPSTWDVFNFTVIEGMASMRPVVCSDAAGASELIEDGVTGFTYDARSPAALAEKLQYALSLDPSRLVEIGHNAREVVLRALDPQTIAQERLTAYKALSSSPVLEKPADWFDQLARPRQRGPRDLAFLDRLPMRSLADYLVRRASRRIRAG